MKYQYSFPAGGTTEIEVSEEWKAFLENEDRLEDNNDQTNTRRHFSMNQAEDILGMQFADPASAIVPEFANRLQLAIDSLSEDQQALVRAIFYDRQTVGEYAKAHGVTSTAISHRFRLIETKLKNILRDPHF